MQLRFNPFTQQFELTHNGRTRVVPPTHLVALGGDIEALVHTAQSQPFHTVEVPNVTNARGVTRRVYKSALY